VESYPDQGTDQGIVLYTIGDRSQIINVGQVIARGGLAPVVRVRGEGAVALNLGQILITGPGLGALSGSTTGTHVTNKGTIVVTGDGGSFGMGGFGDGHQVSNFGLIETHGIFATGIESWGGPFQTLGLNLQIVNGGHIVTEGTLAIGAELGLTSFTSSFAPAADGQIINSGVIETKGDGAAGVVMAGNSHHLVNSGQITTDGGGFDAGFAFFHAVGVVISGDDALVENSQSGVIESKNVASAAVELNVLKRNGLTDSKTSSDLENYGLVKGVSIAVLGGAGEETVINHGQITGDVVLGSGADTFVFATGGRLTGMLYLGGGDDLVRIEKGSGSMTIADFAAGPAGKDIIDISAFYDSFADLKANTHQFGNDVAIGLGHNDQLMLANVKLGALDSGDFMFNPTT
jgi:hypothetical protein